MLRRWGIEMNLPNKLTVFRMMLVPVIVIVFLTFGNDADALKILGSELTWSHVIVAFLFVTASFTDMLDGNIARKNNLVTTFGKFMDPIADKMLVNTMLVLLAYEHLIPVLCVLLMICRDLIVDAIRLMASQQQIVIAAKPLGKLKTVAQMVGITLVLLNNFPLGLIGIDLGQIAIWMATAVSLISGWDYFKNSKDMIFESI